MRRPGLGIALAEARSAWSAVQSEIDRSEAGAVAVSGVLADQLARELGVGAEPGAVGTVEGVVLEGAAVAVRVLAGEPSEEDEAFVSSADRSGVPLVLVQLWPQPDWTPPFVLSPFVVECRAGEGFPLGEIADRIGEAVDRAPALAARVPALREPIARRTVRDSVIRAGLLGLTGRARPVIALEQLRMASRFRSFAPGPAAAEVSPQLVATTAAVLASGFAFRAVARAARRALPAPAVNVAVAAAGTWALAEALRRLDASSGR